MPLSKPSQLQQFLKTLGVQPKKGLSQNFLIDGNIIRKILAEAHIQKGDTVLEIGPGPGALTEALVAQGASVFAVEKDPVFAEALKRLPQVEVFNQDIREFDFSLLPQHTKVVSNLPYHLTAPILGLLVPRYPLFQTVTVMVQYEVAQRMIALPKTKDYSALTIFLNFHSTPHYAFKVSRHCFFPQPKVDSAVVTLTLKEPPSVPADQFFAFIHHLFQHRRKMIKTLLGPPSGTFLEELNQNPKARPEELSLDTFLTLYRSLNLLA